MLRELEYRIATVLERKGGYENVNLSLSLAVARSTFAAHQARRVRLEGSTLQRSMPVVLQPLHEEYRKLLCKGPEPTRSVHVAMLDSNVSLDHLPSTRHTGSIAVGQSVDPDLAAAPASWHGAVTAAIIGDLSPTAEIEIFPVAAPREYIDESAVLAALEETAAQVIAMCLSLRFPVGRSAKTRENVLARRLRELAPDRIVVVATGNRDRQFEGVTALFPSIHRRVIAISSIGLDLQCSEFSRYEFPGFPDDPLHLVAPGGSGWPKRVRESPASAGTTRVVGTSVAAAYAAGVIARSLGRVNQEERPDSISVKRRLEKQARDSFPTFKLDPTKYGAGLAQQFDPCADE